MDATPGSLLHAELAENSASNTQLPAQIFSMRRRTQLSYKGVRTIFFASVYWMLNQRHPSQPQSWEPSIVFEKLAKMLVTSVDTYLHEPSFSVSPFDVD